MQEDDFVQQVTLLVKEVLPEQYIPIQKANLYYQITVDNNLDVTLDLKKPKRGDSAFQTDLCIFLKKNELMWLRGKDLDKKRGKKVSVRRVLYYLAYRGLPTKRITMICDEPERCINPCHMRIRGFEAEANQHVLEQIEKGWLHPADAVEMFGTAWPGYDEKILKTFDPDFTDVTDLADSVEEIPARAAYKEKQRRKVEAGRITNRA